MDHREKLVDIVCDAMEADGCIGHCNHPPCFAVERVVNALITHGVTVQEWIPQAEFPWMGEEIAKLCIRYMEDYADFHGYASSKKVKAHIVRLLELEKEGRIAILPQPPKGE